MNIYVTHERIKIFQCLVGVCMCCVRYKGVRVSIDDYSSTSNNKVIKKDV